jgi:hypothetical protein
MDDCRVRNIAGHKCWRVLRRLVTARGTSETSCFKVRVQSHGQLIGEATGPASTLGHALGGVGGKLSAARPGLFSFPGLRGKDCRVPAEGSLLLLSTRSVPASPESLAIGAAGGEWGKLSQSLALVRLVEQSTPSRSSTSAAQPQRQMVGWTICFDSSSNLAGGDALAACGDSLRRVLFISKSLQGPGLSKSRTCCGAVWGGVNTGLRNDWVDGQRLLISGQPS